MRSGWRLTSTASPPGRLRSRIAGEMLVMDAGHARRVVASAACLGLAVLALAVSMFWRRARLGLWGLALAALLLAPWPSVEFAAHAGHAHQLSCLAGAASRRKASCADRVFMNSIACAATAPTGAAKGRTRPAWRCGRRR